MPSGVSQRRPQAQHDQSAASRPAHAGQANSSQNVSIRQKIA
jgi:hypothetical protein